MKPLLILGTGSLAEETADMASEIPGLTVVGYVTNMDREKCDTLVEGRPVFWIDELSRLAATHDCICALGTTRRDSFIREATERGAVFRPVVHPSAQVPASTTLGPGCVIHAGVIMASHTRLGSHVLVNRGATIGHHTEVGDFTTIGPGVNLAGHCHLQSRIYLGIGATIIDHITIGESSVVGAGAVVTAEVPERVLVVGVPAKIIKRDIAGK